MTAGTSMAPLPLLCPRSSRCIEPTDTEPCLTSTLLKLHHRYLHGTAYCCILHPLTGHTLLDSPFSCNCRAIFVPLCALKFGESRFSLLEECTDGLFQIGRLQHCRVPEGGVCQA